MGVLEGDVIVCPVWVVRWLVRPVPSYRGGTRHGATVVGVWLVLARPVVGRCHVWLNDAGLRGVWGVVRPVLGAAIVARPVARPGGVEIEGLGAAIPTEICCDWKAVDDVAELAVELVAAATSALVDGAGGGEFGEGAVDVGGAYFEAFGDVAGLALGVGGEPRDDAFLERWEVVSVGLDEVEAHGSGVGVPADAVADGVAGFGFAVFGLEFDEG